MYTNETYFVDDCKSLTIAGRNILQGLSSQVPKSGQCTVHKLLRPAWKCCKAAEPRPNAEAEAFEHKPPNESSS